MHASSQLSLRLPAPLNARIRAFAASAGCSQSAAVRLALARGLKAYEEEEGEGRIGYEQFLDPPKEKTGRFVYFIREDNDGAIKIGVCTGDPDQRLQTLQTSTPVRLKLLFAMPGGHKKEQALHRRFAAIRIRGEWFQAHASLLEFIEKQRTRRQDVARSRQRR